MQKVMRGLAILVSLTVLAVMAFDLRRFIVVQKVSLFSIDTPLAYIVFVMTGLVVFVVIDGIQDLRWLKVQGKEGGDTRKGAYDLLWVLVFMAAILLYVFLVKQFHFLLTTLVFMAVGMFLLNDSGQKVGVKLVRVLIAAGITVPVLYAVFNYAFEVVLP
ncbi:MAG TPA: tripartite tricarboxylate transporter TctB family protein [Magnetospirillaceae bacterium]|nr:tripartite tricarboxylate transporter TctB family protein [Magnetospirillaceae bacterium]